MDKDLIEKQLQALLYIPAGEVDDTRFERLHDILQKYCEQDEETLISFYNSGFIATINEGLKHEDFRVVAVCLRLIGEFGYSWEGFSLLMKVIQSSLRSTYHIIG